MSWQLSTVCCTGALFISNARILRTRWSKQARLMPGYMHLHIAYSWAFTPPSVINIRAVERSLYSEIDFDAPNHVCINLSTWFTVLHSVNRWSSFSLSFRCDSETRFLADTNTAFNRQFERCPCTIDQVYLKLHRVCVMPVRFHIIIFVMLQHSICQTWMHVGHANGTTQRGSTI